MAILLATNLSAEELAHWTRQLRDALPGERIVSDRQACAPDTVDIAIVANPPPGALQGLPALRLIQSLWAGVDRLLRDATIPAQVPLARMVDPAMNEAMAETALWAVLSLQRDCFDYARQQREQRWLQHAQRRADELNVGVLGLGQMGRAVALRLAANGYRVVGWSRHPAPVAGIATRSGDAELQALLAEAHVVINLLPLTPATQALFHAGSFAAMRRGAGFVNLARGGHLVEADLLDALERGQLRHAVLDVFSIEPLPAEHAFWSHPRVTVLPHVAAQTDARSAARVVAANVRALREGQALAHLVDRSRGY